MGIISLGYEHLIDIDCNKSYSIYMCGYNYQNMIINKLIYEENKDVVVLELGKIIYCIGDYESDKLISFMLSNTDQSSSESLIRCNFNNLDMDAMEVIERFTRGKTYIGIDYYNFLKNIPIYREYLDIKIINTNKDYKQYYSHFYTSDVISYIQSIIDQHT